jgi:hypothetical protein
MTTFLVTQKINKDIRNIIEKSINDNLSYLTIERLQVLSDFTSFIADRESKRETPTLTYPLTSSEIVVLEDNDNEPNLILEKAQDLRKVINNFIQNISLEKLLFIDEFILYLKEKESLEATQELMGITQIEEDLKISEKEISEGNLFEWEDSLDDL